MFVFSQGIKTSLLQQTTSFRTRQPAIYWEVTKERKTPCVCVCVCVCMFVRVRWGVSVFSGVRGRLISEGMMSQEEGAGSELWDSNNVSPAALKEQEKKKSRKTQDKQMWAAEFEGRVWCFQLCHMVLYCRPSQFWWYIWYFWPKQWKSAWHIFFLCAIEHIFLICWQKRKIQTDRFIE